MTNNTGNLTDQTSQVTLIASNWMHIPVSDAVAAVVRSE